MAWNLSNLFSGRRSLKLARRKLVRQRFRPQFEALEGRALLAAGALDTSFSGDGKTTVDFGLNFPPHPIPHHIEAADVAVQSDGKTVVAGTWRPVNGSGQQDFAVVRFNLDGTLDQTFGGGATGDHKGIFFAHVGKRAAEGEFARAIAIGPDGRIVVVGRTEVARTLAVDTVDFAVIRLMPNGTLDNSFDGDGMRTVRFAEDTLAIANDVAILGDGTIVLVGETLEIDVTPPTFSISDNDFAVALLNPDGSLKSNGRRVFGFGGNDTDDAANAVTIDPNGNIVVVGQSDAGTGSFALARLKPNGDFDTSFGTGGRLLHLLPGRANAAALDVLAQGDKIVVVGKSVTNVVRRSEMVRFHSTGLIDVTFGAGGNFVVETPGMNAATAIVRSADGRLIVGGHSTEFVIAGYTADGLLDTSFGTSGTVVTAFGGTDATLSGLASGPGRRFVATGGALAATARYLDKGANVVHATSFLDPIGGETAPNPASFFVFRQERLPVATRVFFSIGGTATFSSFFGSDYRLSGLTVPLLLGQDLRPFVDIPANETFKQVTLSPIDDRLIEGTETAVFSILASGNYEVGSPSSATLRILDNDNSTRVGTAALTPSAVDLPANGKVTYQLAWTHPRVWRDLSTIELRIVNDEGVLAWIKWDAITNAISLFDPKAGLFCQSGQPGSGQKLKVGDAELDLRDSAVVGTGPLGQSVTLTLALKLKGKAKNGPLDYRVEVAASEVNGNSQGFEQAGTLRVGP